VPLEQATFAITPAVESEWKADPRDPNIVNLQLNGLEQGAQYKITVSDATSKNGAPLAEPTRFDLVTPPPLTVARFASGSDASIAPITTKPTIAFAEPVRDRRVAEAAIRIEPPVPGRFEWVDDRQVRFIPTRGFPYDTSVKVSIQSGLQGPRSVAGGYLDETPTFSFSTVPDKTIDVDVTRQVMTLFEGDKAIRTLPVATGLPGADTPIGEFRVEYKMRSANFRGVNSATGTRYDLPNVNYILAFQGDYTIHGAYWRQAFGRPGSNGCVSLSDPDAKTVFDWAPDGTLIRIHY
jgi:lipoprotein-anchoring transpeptidase ErfK/SrfK